MKTCQGWAAGELTGTAWPAGFSGGSAEAAASASISASACFARQMREESDQISHTKSAMKRYPNTFVIVSTTARFGFLRKKPSGEQYRYANTDLLIG